MTNGTDPFRVVLIDLQKAAQGEIQCIKIPLTKELKYVAISYRWGELQETNVDTGVGYVASITSFAIQDFYELCKAMTMETDLQSMDYVWVDAICVNQVDHDQRKETIYHMNEVYEQAIWILAVPDLHAAHLRTMTNNERDMGCIQKHQRYLYHLVHGNINELRKMDQAFLNEINVPQDSNLKQLLTKYTDCFADSFMTISFRKKSLDDFRSLAHLYDVHHDTSAHTMRKKKPKRGMFWQIHLLNIKNHVNNIRSLHQCKDDKHCPLYDIDCTSLQQRRKKEWHRDIIEKGTAIRQAMHFLSDLVEDWSSRVWVISEFHIAKKKNNLKFWFNQLNDDDAVSFFKFEMESPQLKTLEAKERLFREHGGPVMTAVYYYFYGRLINQLNGQTFLEMMLKSKASKNEDRFYSIFPLFSEYKHLLQKEDLVKNAHSLLSVKLKLYQVMTNEHKMLLLYFSMSGKMTWALPTFATPAIDWPHYSVSDRLCLSTCMKNVDIKLLRQGGLCYLRLKPATWSISRNADCTNTTARRALSQIMHHKTPCNDAVTRVDVIRFVFYLPRFLIGSISENTWILGTDKDVELKSKFESVGHLPCAFSGFYVY